MAVEIKQTTKGIFKNKGFLGFLYGYSLFFIVGLILFVTTKHGDVVLFINRYSREEWDSIVLFLTDFGLGSYVAIAMVLLLFLRVRYGLLGLINLGLVGIFTNVLKKMLFSDRIRPFNYFYYDDFHRFIYTAELNYHFSFPSGHTMTIFSALSLMAFFVGKRWAGIVFFIAALMIGFTRIYLLQHFFLDVYVGAVTGVFCTFLSVWLLTGPMRLQRFSWFDKPIYQIRFKTSGTF